MSESSVVGAIELDAQRHFRSTLAMFATGVAVITAPREEGAPVGITVASFNSVSLDPPLILFSVDRRCHSLGDLCATPRYAVNVLAEAQQDISNRFARANSGKWDGIDAGSHDASHVLLPDALATFECEPYAQHDGGDHVIFIGRVVRHQSRQDGRPLIFFGGKYRALDASPAAA
ncbi:p-hydroxyphenylacetate 3-hydroxylase, reductase component [Cupriavidus yeoncheonensis]|uniref:p-hydroxyphenylacetate 3-hydroxylase, reductase component n=1 Tax=Cupriavidus yeoncheonensis TaxID=1462994 RepID=A0A916MXR3_9BURK|nr:flavin reductase family protein [Cupriavidus yeoncheonensis]CAG2155408.1 p-hydroxyphenylacetate 3-hydroxylase, reductase component [Cupriavidus yeoncheonensis]